MSVHHLLRIFTPKRSQEFARIRAAREEPARLQENLPEITSVIGVT